MDIEVRKGEQDSLFSSMESDSSLYEDIKFEDECKMDTSSCLPTHIEPVIKIQERRLCDTICSDDELYAQNPVEHDG